MDRARTIPACSLLTGLAVCAVLLVNSGFSADSDSNDRDENISAETRVHQNAQRMMAEGKHAFRYETFGDEAFWGDALKLHQAIAGAQQGGVGSGVSPATALTVGLKLDVDALPDSLRSQLARGAVDLNSSSTTLALLRLNAVLGITGIFDKTEHLASIGIQCALCHSTVDNSFAQGIGHRLEGWANRDLNVGAIIALAPDLSVPARVLGVDQPTVRAVLNSWGSGKFDAELFLDGKPFQPGGKTAAVLIPPAFGLAGVNLGTWTGFGSTTYWNALVANLEMHGKGTFYDPRLNDPLQYPVAVKAGSNNTRNDPDLVTSKLAALHFYQLAIPAPRARTNVAQIRAVLRGKEVFDGRAQCARCHVPPLFTEPGYNMHAPEEIGIDDFQSSRSPTKMYRTSPLKGLFTHQKGGFYHDGRFVTLQAVVDHYDNLFQTGLSQDEKNDLIAYLESL